MGDPDYVYRPWDEDRRRAASERNKKRLGILPGLSRVQGVDVEEGLADALRTDIYWVSANMGRPEARALLEKATKIDWDMVGDMLAESTGLDDLAAFFDVPEWFIERQTKRFRRINRKRVYREQ